MTKLIATSETGTTYTFSEGGFVDVSSKTDGEYTLRIWDMKSSKIKGDTESLGFPWVHPEQ